MNDESADMANTNLATNGRQAGRGYATWQLEIAGTPTKMEEYMQGQFLLF
jgi:hypothetical protein